ncbi:uncharacterized protein DS421_11g321890 [Arachis hypogaea]|nr:uncharacterized protein DS421_11g321890 [Arachis hypogaea]
MTTGKRVTNRSRGRSSGRISTGTPKTSQSSPSTSTTPVTLQAMGAQDQLFIVVPNPNYVAPSDAPPTQPGSHLAASPEWTPPPPPSDQQPTISTMTPPVIDIAVSESSHGSQPDVPPPPFIIRMTIWLDGLIA